MASSKAHAVQTSAHASVPVEPDMFAADLASNEHYVKALQYTGQILHDAVLRQMPNRPSVVALVPVVEFDMACHVGTVSFTVQVQMPFSPSTRAAADAKVAHCRKGRWVTVDAAHLDVRIALPHCSSICVLDGEPS